MLPEEIIPPKKNSAKEFLYIFSPCVLAVLLCIILIAQACSDMESSKGWSYLGIIILRPALITIAIAGIATKIALRKKLLLLWIVEVAVIVITYFIFVSPYTS